VGPHALDIARPLEELEPARPRRPYSGSQRSGIPLFYPSTGSFALLVPGGVAHYVPIDPHLAIGLIPRGVDAASVPIGVGTLQNASAGTPSCRRLVVHSSVLHLGAEKLAAIVEAAQNDNHDLLNARGRIAARLAAAFALVGQPSPFLWDAGPRYRRPEQS
jgi:hypothetical protein